MNMSSVKLQNLHLPIAFENSKCKEQMFYQGTQGAAFQILLPRGGLWHVNSVCCPVYSSPVTKVAGNRARASWLIGSVTVLARLAHWREGENRKQTGGHGGCYATSSHTAVSDRATTRETREAGRRAARGSTCSRCPPPRKPPPPPGATLCADGEGERTTTGGEEGQRVREQEPDSVLTWPQASANCPPRRPGLPCSGIESREKRWK
nr:hypothetical protein Iba_chr13eCG9850 [Ipomoea batatas]